MTDTSKADIAASMLELVDNFAPLLDAADGMRNDMERRGWSPTASEQASLTWLLSMMASIGRHS